jgi:hypothetical protein
VTYRYTNTFRGGRFPLEWTRYRMASLRKEVPEFTIQVEEMEVGTDHLEASEIDPRTLYQSHGTHVIVWSNNLEYAVGKHRLVKVVTAEESAERVRAFQARRHAGGSKPRSLTAVLLCLSGLLCIALLVKLVRSGRRRV